MARLAREHNDANVLAIGAGVTGEAVALDCLDTDWIELGRRSWIVERVTRRRTLQRVRDALVNRSALDAVLRGELQTLL